MIYTPALARKAAFSLWTCLLICNYSFSQDSLKINKNYIQLNPIVINENYSGLGVSYERMFPINKWRVGVSIPVQYYQVNTKGRIKGPNFSQCLYYNGSHICTPWGGENLIYSGKTDFFIFSPGIKIYPFKEGKVNYSIGLNYTFGHFSLPISYPYVNEDLEIAFTYTKDNYRKRAFNLANSLMINFSKHFFIASSVETGVLNVKPVGYNHYLYGNEKFAFLFSAGLGLKF